MGRPKKAPEERLVTVGTRVSPSLLKRIRNVMHDLHKSGRIARANESAACAWMVGQGMATYEHTEDSLLQVLLAIWPQLNEVAREAVVGAARGCTKSNPCRRSP